MVKIIDVNTGKIIDITKTVKYIQFLPYDRVYPANKTNAQGIITAEGKMYSFIKAPTRPLPFVKIVEIAEEEFMRLQSLINSGSLGVDDEVINQIANAKIKELSDICKAKIIAGFNIVLTDGNTYNFRLTTEDQLNLMLLDAKLRAGSDTFVYHATNQPCRIFNQADMSKIIHAYTRLTAYHTTYFNTAKHYILSLKDIRLIEEFYYGQDISDYAQDVAVKQILTAGGVF